MTHKKVNTNLSLLNPDVTVMKYFILWLTDYSKGFGGKYGVQKDRVDQVIIISSASYHSIFYDNSYIVFIVI